MVLNYKKKIFSKTIKLFEKMSNELLTLLDEWPSMHKILYRRWYVPIVDDGSSDMDK